MRLAKGNGVAAVKRNTEAGPIPHVFMRRLGPLAAPPGAVVLAKPFREADLIRAIARALGQVSIPTGLSSNYRDRGVPQTMQRAPAMTDARGVPRPEIAAPSVWTGRAHA